MNKADQEILEILKDIFQLKRVRPLESDDNFRLWCIRMFFLSSIISLIVRITFGFSNNEITAEFSARLNTQIAIFFTLLFWQINNKSENPSLIIFGLTWVSLMLALYI